jgi:hypothetical protein
MAKKCTTTKNHSRIKVEENRRKAVFLNPEREEHDVTEIDGCVVVEGPRCDFLVSDREKASVLVELKGADVRHACEQLLNSAVHADVKPLLHGQVGFLVICSKVPRFDSVVARAKQTCMKKHKAGLHIVCNQGEFDLEKVIKIDGPY